MTLRVSDFDQYILLSDRIDYSECRLGEAKTISLNFKVGTSTSPTDITGWIFSVSYKDILATVNGSGSTLSSISNFSILDATSKTDPNLIVNITNATQGQAILTIPSSITSIPSDEIVIDTENSLIKLLTIQATYLSTVSGFNIIDKYAVGVIIRFA